ERKLDMVETGLVEGAQPLLGEADAGGDEIRVEARLPCTGHQRLEIGTRGRLASRKMDMQHTHLRRLAEDVEPGSGRQFLLLAGEFDRVRAIGTGERAAMGELGQQRERRIRFRLHGRTSTILRSTRPSRKAAASAAIRSAGAS